MTIELLAAAQDMPNPWGTYGLFALAGLSVGASIAAYQNDAKKLTVACALLAALLGALALMNLIGVMS